MKNEEKARELAKCSTCFCAKWCKGIDGDCCDELEHLLAMAQWKDEQLKDACSNCEDNLIKMGKRCAWRSLSNDYCWEK